MRGDAAGTLDNLTGEASFDLERLAAELGQFIDLSGVSLAGAGKASFSWQRAGDQTFTAAATADAANLQVAVANQPVLSEQAINAKLDATGKLDGSAMLPQFNTATVSVTASGEQFSAELAQAQGNSVGQSLPLRVTWQGDLAGWLQRGAVRQCAGLGTGG